MAEHRLTARQVHNKWNRDLVPAVEVDPGDVVVFETQDVSGGQIEPGSPAAALATIIESCVSNGKAHRVHGNSEA
jgi:acetamidase/formamidase